MLSLWNFHSPLHHITMNKEVTWRQVVILKDKDMSILKTIILKLCIPSKEKNNEAVNNSNLGGETDDLIDTNQISET